MVLLLYFFIEGNSVEVFAFKFQMWKKQIEKTYRCLRSSYSLFPYWRKSCDCSDVLVLPKVSIEKKMSYRKTYRRLIALFSVSLLKENLSNKKRKNGKKREKSHFHVFSINQRCFVEFLVYFFPFSLFPPKK